MAYTKTTWTNREVENPRTFTLTENADGTVTLTPAEGEVFVAGTPIDAVYMNNIETQVEANDLAIQDKVNRAGDVMTGNLEAQIINARTTLREAGVNLNDKYVSDNIGKFIQSGTTSIACSSGNNTKDVTFPIPFASTPTVVATVANSTDANAFGRIVCGVTTTKTSITVYSTMSATVNVSWFAIGTI